MNLEPTPSTSTGSPWICVFCKHGPHLKGMGDLFGPYILDSCAAPPLKAPVAVIDSTKEVWFHETCVAWTSNVYLAGRRLINLEEAIRNSDMNVCVHCKLRGAQMGCHSRGCTEKFHYLCAVESGCKLDHETFSTLCPHHSTL